MSEFIDFDPMTGVSHWWDYDESTDKATITTVQDVEPILEWCKAAANEGITDDGIKKGWWLIAKIPAVLQVKLHQMGVDITDPKAADWIAKWIKEHAPQYLTTSKRIVASSSKIYLPNA